MILIANVPAPDGQTFWGVICSLVSVLGIGLLVKQFFFSGERNASVSEVDKKLSELEARVNKRLDSVESGWSSLRDEVSRIGNDVSFIRGALSPGHPKDSCEK